MVPSVSRGARSLRFAVPWLPPPRTSWLLPLSQQHRQQQLRKASSASPQQRPHGLSSRQTRPVVCPSCQSYRSGRLSSVIVLPTLARPRRGFHVGTLVNTAIDMTETTIMQLHVATGTPWFITIPLVAMAVNLLVRIPFGIHTQKLVQKQARLNDLAWAWGAVHTKEVHEEFLKKNQEKRLRGLPPLSLDITANRVETTKRLEKTLTRLYSKFGVQRWRLWGGIFALPPWLVVIEALRRMSGAPTGLLGLIFSRSTGKAETMSTGAGRATTATPTDLPAGEDMSSIPDAATAAADGVAASTPGALTDVSSLFNVPTDSSLATGGCLWFTDLTVPDPYYVLPIALSAILFINIIPATDAGRRELFGLNQRTGVVNPRVSAKEAMRRGFQRSLLILSLVVGPATLHFPSSIHLYWICSSLSNFAINRGLRAVFPVSRPPQNHPASDNIWIAAPPPSFSGPSNSTANNPDKR